MTPSPGPLRVEQVLRLLPDIDALTPLRRFLISTSQATTAVDPYRTVGKRFVQPADLREFVPQAIAEAAEHLRALYDAAIEALEAEQADDEPGVVRALLRAGRREEAVGRFTQAREWYNHALGVAEGLRDRRPEIEVLRHMGQLDVELGQLEEGARRYQKSYYLADVELDLEGAAIACQSMGELAGERSQWQGAESWFKRGLKYSESNPLRSGYLHLGLGEVARARGQIEGAADQLKIAQQNFDRSGHAEGTARTLNARGQLEAEEGNSDKALASWREALAELHQAGDADRFEMTIRLNVCRRLMEWGRLAEAEDELRRAEERAIVLNLHHQLARLYMLMGKLRGLQGDETGFVFFEKAVELCQGATPYPRLEAEVYREYARFRRELGDSEEAIGYLSRAREILEISGDDQLLAKVEKDLQSMPVH